MQTVDDLISKEVMGGWPIFKMNLKEILLALGAENDGTCLKFHVNDPKLQIYPQRLISDGMAYGIGQEWIHDVEVSSKEGYINIWTEPELPKDELEKEKQWMLEIEELRNKKQNENSR